MFYMYRLIGMCLLFMDSVYPSLCRPRGVWVRTFISVCASPTYPSWDTHVGVRKSISYAISMPVYRWDLGGELNFGGFVPPCYHSVSMDHFMNISLYFSNLAKTQAINEKLGRHLTNTALN